MSAATEARPAPPSRPLARLLVPLGAVTGITAFASALTNPFLAVFLSQSLGVGPVASAVFLVLMPLASVVMATVLGHLSDRRRIRRRLLLVAAVSGGIGSLCFALVDNYWVLLAVSMTLMAVAGSLSPQVFAYAKQLLDHSRSTRAPMTISTLRMLVSVAWVLGPPLAGMLLGVIGFGGLFALTAGGFVVAAMVVVFWLAEPSPPRSGADLPVTRHRDGGLNPTVWSTMLAFLMLQWAIMLAVLTLPLFISEDLHGEIKDAGLVLGLCAALEIPLMVFFGALATRLPLRGLVLFGTGFGLAYYVAVAASTAVWQVAAAQVLNACYISAVLGLGISYFQDLMPTSPGLSTTLFTNTNRIAAMFAGAVFGYAQYAGYRLAYLACGGLCFAGLLLLAFTRPRPRPQP
ncbi:MAG: sugar efflux transporter [Dactylosporangium sp.]|nr:sugar efflux transporter [Dactylosporangium sp.]NNJ62966.1 sugar efflux transporter [Dactylosporangium sp.]